jgi:CBS domain containing-hemolysin-like protein
MLLLARINPGDAYVTGVLPGIVVFGLGLTLVVAPVTATVLAAADVSRAGIASAVNNAVARIAGLIAVAVLPLLAGITGERFYQPAAMTHGFHIAALACAAAAAAGGLLAWLAISDDVLEAEPERRGQAPVSVSTDFTCAVGGPPLRPAIEHPPIAKRS